MPEEYLKGKDMPLLADGSTYHLGVKKGDLYPRILTVGSHSRAKAISTVLDPLEKTIESNRGFLIYTGKYNGVGVSIIAIGMGAPMMDFMIREASFVDEGPMACIRLGTCGLLDKDLVPGTLACAGGGCSYVYANFGADAGGCWNDASVTKDSKKFLVSKAIPGNDDLNKFMVEELKKAKIPTAEGKNAAGEFFYSTQGRKNPHFDDCDNEDLIDACISNGVISFEMETHCLFYLAKHRTVAPLAAAGCAIGILNRTNPSINVNISPDQLHKLEVDSGRACLAALARFEL